MKKNVYLANGLFSESDFLYNKEIIKILKNLDMDFYAPQENNKINNKESFAESTTIFNQDNYYLDKSNILIAVIDGVEIDSGVAAEIGRFSALSEYADSETFIIGLYTDSRLKGTNNKDKLNILIDCPEENQFMYRNLYVVGAIKKNGVIVSSLNELEEVLFKIKEEGI